MTINMNKRRKVYGVGINDANYETQKHEYIEGVRRTVWVCPFYSTWTKMIKRCYSEYSLKEYPSYMGCSVDKSWLLFSNFKSWMECQKWKDHNGNKLQLDKDLKIKGNRVYCSESCIFVGNMVNNFFQVHKSNSKLMVGVTIKGDKFVARCRNPFKKTNTTLGLFNSEEEARCAYLKEKIRLGILLAEQQRNCDVKDIILENLVPYKKELKFLSSKHLTN